MLKILRNLLLLEVLLATIVVGIIAAVLLHRLAYYQELAEKANMESTITTIKSALRIKLALMMTQGEVAQYANVAAENPFDWLEKKPANYLGEHTQPPSNLSLKGSWYFDMSNRMVVYTPLRQDYFVPPNSGPVEIRWGMVPIIEEGMGHDQQQVSSVRIVLEKPYKWF